MIKFKMIAEETRVREVARKRMGTIKTHTVSLADQYRWTVESFKMEKSDLRKMYKIDRTKMSDQFDLPKHEILEYLYTLCHLNFQNHIINIE